MSPSTWGSCSERSVRTGGVARCQRRTRRWAGPACGALRRSLIGTLAGHGSANGPRGLRRRCRYSEWIQVGLADVEFPDGGRTEHHIVRMRPAAIAAVLDDSGERALFMWRHRFVPDLWNWELPGGFVEDGEDPAVAASREVEEETGWRPRNLEHLVTFEPMIGMITTPHHVYLARGAERVGDPTEVNEMQQLRWIPLTDVPHLIANGKVCSSGALVALLHVLAISGPQARDETRFD
jgi:8-oxo-dGDP phosphatase